MKPPHRLGLFLVLFVALPMAFASAVVAAPLQKAVLPAAVSPQLLTAYARAQEQEDKAREAMQALDALRSAAANLKDAAGSHVGSLQKARSSAQARGESIAAAARRARDAQDSRRAALTAVDGYAVAAASARDANGRYAGATGDRRIALARAADGAAQIKAQALAKATKAVQDAAWKSDLFRSALSDVASRSERFDRDTAMAVKSAEALAQSAAGVEAAARDAAGKTSLAARLQGDIAQAARSVAQLRKAAAELPSRLTPLPILQADMNRGREQEPPGAKPLADYQVAVLQAVIEADALAYVSAVRQASLRGCPADTACGKGLEAEVAEAGMLVGTSRQEAERASASVRDLMRTTDATLASLDGLAPLAAADLPLLQSIAAAAASVEPATDALVAAAGAALDTARRQYAEARKAADAAYLAAYGQQRLVASAQTASTAMAVPSDVQTSAQMSSSAWRVEAHAWEFFTVASGESQGYGAYTYVLFGHRVGERMNPEVKQRYRALLDAVIGSTSYRTETPVPPEKLNLFCIPGKKTWEEIQAAGGAGGGDDAYLDDYASSLAFSDLALAGNGAVQSHEILDQLNYSPGPFLLTTLKPLSRIKTYSPMLFVDLSRFHPDTFADIVRIYKQALVEEPPREQEIWEPSRLQWTVFAAYELATHLANVKSAVSGWFVPGGDKPVKTALR